MAKVEDTSFSEMSRFSCIVRMRAEVIWETGCGPNWILGWIVVELDDLKCGRKRQTCRSLHLTVEATSVGSCPVLLFPWNTVSLHIAPHTPQYSGQQSCSKLGTSSVCHLRWREKGLQLTEWSHFMMGEEIQHQGHREHWMPLGSWLGRNTNFYSKMYCGPH